MSFGDLDLSASLLLLTVPNMGIPRNFLREESNVKFERSEDEIVKESCF